MSTSCANNTELVPWEDHHETIFVEWADKAACYKWMHNKSYLKYHRKRNMYTIPVIIMSTLTGTANFALEKIPLEYQNFYSIFIGSVNILAGIITTVAQFLKLNELTEEHRTAYISWGKFNRSIRIELIKSPTERPDLNYFIKSKKEEYDRLMETSPQIDTDVVTLFKKNLTAGVNKDDVLRKLNNFNTLAKPELFNEIASIKDAVYKPTEQNDIETGDNSILEKLEAERTSYASKFNVVKEFIDKFNAKYTRNPSKEEIMSNIQDIPVPDLNIIINELLEY